MTEKVYQFKVTDKNLQDYLDKLPNKSDFLRDLIHDYRGGDLVRITESIDVKIKEARLENLGYKNRIEKVKAVHYETFGKAPSVEAREAITQNANGQTVTTSRPAITPNPIPNFTMMQDDEGFLARCKICNQTGDSGKRKFEEAAIEDIAFHLSLVHNKPLYH
jgi:hypothetical protein